MRMMLLGVRAWTWTSVHVVCHGLTVLVYRFCLDILHDFVRRRQVVMTLVCERVLDDDRTVSPAASPGLVQQYRQAANYHCHGNTQPDEQPCDGPPRAGDGGRRHTSNAGRVRVYQLRDQVVPKRYTVRIQMFLHCLFVVANCKIFSVFWREWCPLCNRFSRIWGVTAKVQISYCHIMQLQHVW